MRDMQKRTLEAAMTLREGLQELIEQLREQGKMVVLLDAMLAQTAAADAEQARLARIGELVEGLAADRNFQLTSHVGYHSVSIDWDGEYIAAGDGATLLDALEALKAKATGGTDER